jgi:hypothetical protein
MRGMAAITSQEEFKKSSFEHGMQMKDRALLAASYQ